jgi:glyoxylase-like metal-dependent hydrolase (beta-lactamase superfamily II)
LKWATEPNDRERASFLKENILPMEESGKLKFVEVDEGASLFDEDITLKFAYGHTEAMMLPTIKYKGKTVVYMADLLPSAAHLPIPYVMAYDMQPLKTLNEKKAFLQEAVENDYVLFFEHDAKIECCTLQKTDKGVRVKETFNLEDL